MKKRNLTKEQMHEEWQRLFDHSDRTKISEGAAQINKVITTAHKDQWRRNTKKTQHKKSS